MQKASTPSGATELMRLLDTPGLDPGLTANLGSYLGGGEKHDRPAVAGKRPAVRSVRRQARQPHQRDRLDVRPQIDRGVESHGARRTDGPRIHQELRDPEGWTRRAHECRRDPGGLPESAARPHHQSARLRHARGVRASLDGAAVAPSSGRRRAARPTRWGPRQDTRTTRPAPRQDAPRTSRAQLTSGLPPAPPQPTRPTHALAAVDRPRRARADRRRSAALRGDRDGAVGTPRKRPAGSAGHGGRGQDRRGRGDEGRQELHPAQRRDDRRHRRRSSRSCSLLNAPGAAGQGFSFDEVYFDTGSATLKPESTKQLENLAVILQAFRRSRSGRRAHRRTGDATANKKMSSDRAAAVRRRSARRSEAR